MTGIAIGRFDGQTSEWDDFVRAQTGFTHFHLYGWRSVVEKVFRHECIYLAARDSANTLVAVLPLVRVRSAVFGHFLVSMPFLNYGGPIGSTEGVRALVNEAVRIATETRVGLLELRSRIELPIELAVSHRKVTVVRDLVPDADALWSALPGKLRSQVKRPRKEGIEIRFGLDQVQPFHGVFAQHMRDLGTPTQPLALFEAIANTFPRDVEFAVAYHEGVPIACGCGFRWGDEFEITWASALRAYNAMSPNMLLYWELMARVGQDGVRVFNFGRLPRTAGPIDSRCSGVGAKSHSGGISSRTAATPLATRLLHRRTKECSPLRLESGNASPSRSRIESVRTSFA